MTLQAVFRLRTRLALFLLEGVLDRRNLLWDASAVTRRSVGSVAETYFADSKWPETREVFGMDVETANWTEGESRSASGGRKW